MATITTLAQGRATTNIAVGPFQPQVVKHELKLADIVTAGLVTTDKVVYFNVPAGTLVEDMQVQIVDAALSLGSGPRVDVGDSSADTTYVNNASTLTNNLYLTVATASKFYSAADTIFVKITGGTIASTGTIRIVAKLSDYTRNTPAKPKVYTN